MTENETLRRKIVEALGITVHKIDDMDALLDDGALWEFKRGEKRCYTVFVTQKRKHGNWRGM